MDGVSGEKVDQQIENEELKTWVQEQLETVIDPELGIDIVNLELGL